MGRFQKYFKKEFQTQNFLLEHDAMVDFYITPWQRNRSSLILLFIRILILIGCIGTWAASMVIMVPEITTPLWFIFMTHWGVMFNTLCSGFAVLISVMVIVKGPTDSNFGLPWYVKVYWALINISLTIAIFITLFYWILLAGFTDEYDYGMDPVLDVFVHAINSVFMVVLLIFSRHPMRMLHFYFPLIVGIIYLLFTVIFHFAGGISPFGESWIYPMLDWAQPGQTLLLMFGSAIMFIVLHALVVGISVLRDAVTKRWTDSTVLNISDDRYN
ncbi:protein rolling stone-like isoform X2 [Trichoplusia ni]|uniref:Protein rolling stone-like isoform X2 n=1 Tax=Trichoplusia ni TaxID=7111 RepID=A0A7E5WFQ9_TRINI|nr:protein rolling stone-like isoform X2 [Trichoplusia ni]